MEFTIKSGSPEKQRSACVVVGVFDNRKLSLSAELIDRAQVQLLPVALNGAEHNRASVRRPGHRRSARTSFIGDAVGGDRLQVFSRCDADHRANDVRPPCRGLSGHESDHRCGHSAADNEAR